MKAHVTIEPLSILLSPESKEDNAILSALFSTIDRRPFVAEEVVDVIGRPGGFGESSEPSGVMIRIAPRP